MTDQAGAQRRADAVRRVLLQVPNRRRVYEAIVATPGAHVRRMSRDLGMALGVVEHHVRQLEKHDLVFSHQAGRRRTYYAAGQMDPADAALVHALRKPAWARVLASLLEGACGVAALAGRVDLPPTTASYHLRRMRAAGLLEHVRVGRESLYLVQEPDRVRRWLDRLCPAEATGAPDAAFVGLVARARRGPRPGTGGIGDDTDGIDGIDGDGPALWTGVRDAA